ncbi:RecE family exodeoxyribonuclease [Leclercia adecarboxylata]|uniref:RecE family exodeoxyribonuclease n=1 Tax=Leclercia adecarboxylata TaxID=83655 RepID=UPI00254DA406|nr:RecE family exodeoxyribonuclease [Leclercia adecarboxylata]
MEFFTLLKASQKSGKPNGVFWFSAKTEARAKLQVQVIIEDAGIETGRGHDYQLPIFTDYPVFDDLPEEEVIDFTWCDRYELGEDGRTWQKISAPAPAAEPEVATSTATLQSAPVVKEDLPTKSDEFTVPVANRTLGVRIAVHLIVDKYQTHISDEQMVTAMTMSMDEENIYLMHLLMAKNNGAPKLAELSLHAEWKLVQAIKAIFPQDLEHSPASMAQFINAWIEAESGDQHQLVADWQSGKLPAKTTNGQISPKVDEAMQWPVAQMSQRSLILSQFISDEFTHHATMEQRKKIADLEMDTDNSYVQNMLWAADKATGFKSLSTHNVWQYTQAIKTVFAQDKRHELNAMIIFAQGWVETPHIDRGLFVKEWASGKRVTAIQRTDTGTNAGGGNATDRSTDYEHTLDTLDIEIAAATLPMDFDIYNIPGGIHRRAKEIVTCKDSPFKEWSAVLRKTPGVLDYSRAAIFAVVRSAEPHLYMNSASLHAWISSNLTEADHAKPAAETLAAARQFDSAAVVAGVIQGTEPVESLDKLSTEFSVVGKIAAAAANPVDNKSPQPTVAKISDGMYSIEGLMGQQSTTSTTKEAADDVQMEATIPVESKVDIAVSASQGADESGAPAATLTNAQILAAAAPELAKAFSEKENTAPLQDSAQQDATDATPVPEYPAYFEPGRYEGLPNNVYHGANGISSTQVKDARVSLMYFNARHVEKTIAREQSKVLDMGNLVHALALQPENLAAEFSIEPIIPEGAFTTTATLRTFIDEYNLGLPVQLSADDIKRFIEEHNATLPAPVPMGASVEETGQSYMSLPAEFQRIEADQKQTAAAMKACIKEYNATLPAPAKTSGSRDALLEQLSVINPDLVAQEAQKPAPLKVSGTKADLIQSIKSVKPTAVFADELLDAWRENPDDKILVTRAQLATATAIQSALLTHPTVGKFLTHPSRAVEVSYFGFDDETGLEIRVRPDLEIDMNGIRIGMDLKTISMWNVKQSALRAKLHREIIDRDYHLSASMYMNTAALDQFFWIFVNKDEGYHWIAIVEASQELIELGALEYSTTMRSIANAFDTGEWPAPIVDDYADELNDFDLRRLEALRAA